MKVMSVNEFMSRESKGDKLICRLKAHFKKHNVKYRIIGTTIIIFVASSIDFATPTLAANSAIDQVGREIYTKLLAVGKWLIIFKGGVDTLKSISNGDLDGAKRHFFGYGLAYMLLLGLPWIFDTIDELFRDLEKGL